jgi:hypothetical protein
MAGHPSECRSRGGVWEPVRGVRVELLSLGVLARSRKENERRLAIHPLHLEGVDASVRRRIYLERGYGEGFGVPDEQLSEYVAGVRSRVQLLADCDVILLPNDLWSRASERLCQVFRRRGASGRAWRSCQRGG